MGQMPEKNMMMMMMMMFLRELMQNAAYRFLVYCCI